MRSAVSTIFGLLRSSLVCRKKYSFLRGYAQNSISYISFCKCNYAIIFNSGNYNNNKNMTTIYI